MDDSCQSHSFNITPTRIELERESKLQVEKLLEQPVATIC